MSLYEKYLEPVVHEFTTGEYYKEVFEAKKQYFEKCGVVFEEDFNYEDRMTSFMDWYLFDRDLPGVDLPPIQYFVRRHESELSSFELSVYRDFTKQVHSLFRAKRKSWNKKSIRIQDLFTKKTYWVTNAEVNLGIQRGDVFEARIFMFQGEYEFSRGFCFHPKEMEGFIEQEVKKIRFQDTQKQKKLIFELSHMKLKHLRFSHIDVQQIYRFDSKF